MQLLLESEEDYSIQMNKYHGRPQAEEIQEHMTMMMMMMMNLLQDLIFLVLQNSTVLKLYVHHVV